MAKKGRFRRVDRSIELRFDRHITIRFDGTTFVIALMDGTDIAKRVRDGKGGGYWQSLHPNYTVTSPPDHSWIEVAYTADRGRA
jgi:hypothetical protein